MYLFNPVFILLGRKSSLNFIYGGESLGSLAEAVGDGSELATEPHQLVTLLIMKSGNMPRTPRDWIIT
mgnify:CR=1 FL=1